MAIATNEITIIDYNDIEVGTTPPSSPLVDQLWLDSSVTPNELKRYNGTAWIIVNETIVGGRNFALGTSEAKTLVGTNIANQTAKLYNVDSSKIKGNNVVVSFNWKITAGAGTGTLRIQTGSPHYKGLSEYINVSAKSGRSVWSGFLEDAGSSFSTIDVRVDNLVGTLEISNFQVELGNKDTSWRPAPEDLEEKVTALQTDFKIEQGKIATLISDTTIIKNGKETKLKDEVTAINQTLDTVSIKASKSENVINQNLNKTRMQGVGIKLNYSAFNTAANGQIYIHGFDANNEPADVNPTYMLNGVAKGILKGAINPTTKFSTNDVYVCVYKNLSNVYGVYYDESLKTWKTIGLIGSTENTVIDINDSNRYCIMQFKMNTAGNSFEYATLYDSPVILKNAVENNKIVSDMESRLASAEIKIKPENIVAEVKKHQTNGENTFAQTTTMKQEMNKIVASFKESGGYNLIRNSTGKNGIAQWTTNATMGAEFNTNSGATNSEYLYIDSGTITTERYAISSRFKLKPNTKYTMSGWFHNYLTATSFDVMVLSSTSVDENDAGTSYTSVHTLVNAAKTESAWVKYTASLTTPANCKSGYLRIDNNGYNAAGGNSPNRVHWSSVMLNEGEEQPWTPHPSEVYDGIVTLDKSGVAVTASNVKSKTSMAADGFKITKTDTNEDVFKVNADGTLNIKGNITVTGGSIPNSALTTIDGGKILTNTIEAEKLSVIARNKVNNFAQTGTLESWGINADGTGTIADTTIATMPADDVLYPQVKAVKIATTGNRIMYSKPFEVDPNKMYKVTMSIKSDSFSSKYFGLRATTESAVNLSFSRFNVSKRVFEGDDANFYFWTSGKNATSASPGSVSGWINIEGYILPQNIAAKDVPAQSEGTVCSAYAKMKPNTKFMQLRFLNYVDSASPGTYTAYFTNVTVTEIGSGSIHADSITAGNISADRLKAASITAINTTTETAKIQAAKIEDLDASKIKTGTLDAGRIGANTITASHIRVGDFTNLATNYQSGNLDTIYDLAGRDNFCSELMQDITLKAGEEFLYELECKTFDSTTTYPLNAIVILYYTDGTYAYPTTLLSTAANARSWTKVSKSVVISESYLTKPIRGYRIILQIPKDNSLTTSEKWQIRYISVKRKGHGSLIVDGSVTADKMNVKGLTVSNGSVNTLAISSTGDVDINAKSMKVVIDGNYKNVGDEIKGLTVKANKSEGTLSSVANGTRMQDLGVKINYSAFNLPNEGEVYVHGFDANGNAADIDATIYMNGKTFTVLKGMINPDAAVGFPLNTTMYICAFANTNNSRTFGVWYDATAKNWKYKGLIGYSDTGVVNPDEPSYICYMVLNMATAESFNYVYLLDKPMSLRQAVNPSTILEKRLSAAEVEIQPDKIIAKVEAATEGASKKFVTTSAMNLTKDELLLNFKSNGGYNRVKNGNARNGTAFWKVQEYSIVGSPGAKTINTRRDVYTANEFALQVHVPGTMTSGEYGAYQDIETVVGKQYVLTMLLAGHRSNKTILVRGTTAAASGWLTNKAYGSMQGGVNEENWTKVELPFVAQRDTTRIEILINSTSTNDGYIWAKDIMVSEGKTWKPFSPHPSEVYDGNTIIDSNGVTVKNGGLKILNNKNEEVLKGDASGNLILKNSLKVGGTEKGGAIEVLSPSNSQVVNINSAGVAVKTGAIVVTGDVIPGDTYLGMEPYDTYQTMKLYHDRMNLNWADAKNQYDINYGTRGFKSTGFENGLGEWDASVTAEYKNGNALTLYDKRQVYVDAPSGLAISKGDLLLSAGNTITLADSTSWKSLDLNRTNGGISTRARYGIGLAAGQTMPNPAIEMHTSAGALISRFDLTLNSLRLNVHHTDKSAWMAVYVDGARQGYVGKGSSTSRLFYVLSDVGEIVIRSLYYTGVCLDTNGAFRPELNNGVSSGSASQRWSTVYYTSLSAASDSRLKENISYLDEKSRFKSANDTVNFNDCYEFVKNDLKLAQYDYKPFNINSEDKENLCNKIGFIADDIKDTKVGKMLIKETEVEQTGLDYGENDPASQMTFSEVKDVAETVLSYDLTDYTNIIAAALKQATSKIEVLEKENSELKLRLEKIEKALGLTE